MFLTDNPVSRADDDRLGFLPHAKLLCDAIESTSQLPLTVGIFGSWGSGKSSFMYICRDLLEQRGIPTVSFNPWKYDQKDEIWHALIQTVLSEIQRRLENSGDEGRRANIQQALRKAGDLSRAAAWLLARRAVVPLSGGLVGADDVDAARGAWDQWNADQYRHVNRFEADFADVVRTYTGGRRLVLFIDDLDRCMPEAAVTVLDSLKLFLGEAACVFVLAMDHQAMARAAAQRLGGDPVSGRHYLEKLIHFPYYLPTVSMAAMHTQLRADVWEIGDDEAVWRLIEAGFDRNPRRIRRFINALNLTTRALRLIGPPNRDLLLQAGALLALRLEHPDFFEKVRHDPDVWGRMDVAARGNRGALRADELLIAESQPALMSLLLAVSPSRGYAPVPTLAEITTLTDVLTLTTGPDPTPSTT